MAINTSKWQRKPSRKTWKGSWRKFERPLKGGPRICRLWNPYWSQQPKSKHPTWWLRPMTLDAGQRHFGENYVQELEEKANSEILGKCKDIKWHFIGHLQTNKVNKVLSVPNLYMIETVHTRKIAEQLDKAWEKIGKDGRKLAVLVQVNTSREEEKNGVAPEEACDLFKYVLKNCKNLELKGLMTIGKYGYNPADGPNPDFLALRRCRDEVCEKLRLDWKNIDLSMGMSSDYEQAVELGSTMVRVGESIFGKRNQKLHDHLKSINK